MWSPTTNSTFWPRTRPPNSSIAKRAASTYTERRSRDWLKFKCEQGQELVIGGWTDPRGRRSRFGALLLGYWQDGELRYAGRVGTGFDEATLASLGERLENLATPDCPFADRRSIDVKRPHWVEPALVAQVGFSEWTRHGRLRHPRFLGLRDDKPAETAPAAPAAPAEPPAAEPSTEPEAPKTDV